MYICSKVNTRTHNIHLCISYTYICILTGSKVSASKAVPVSLGYDVVEPSVIGVLSNDGSAPRFVPVAHPT